MLIAGCGGSLVGKAAAGLFPSLHVSPEAFALVAMAATFGAAIRATFTGIVFVFELTRDYHAILPLMLASVLAELVTAALLRESLMTEKLSRRGLRVASSYRPRSSPPQPRNTSCSRSSSHSPPPPPTSPPPAS